MNKMSRQLNEYVILQNTQVFHGPGELTRMFGISLRTLQRDLKDLRDAGAIDVTYDAGTDNYICNLEKNSEECGTNEGTKSRINEPRGTRRFEHLNRLSRLCTLIDRLTPTDTYALEEYESRIREHEFMLETFSEVPDNETEEERLDREEMLKMTQEEELPEPPEFADLKAEYYALFPDSYERKRIRDFKALSDAGFKITYSRRYRVHLWSFPGNLI